ncbi:hypothetical protein LTR85_005702 [Meristemomyces frigidus]|nr:hypothetical protein LTR85_005702 [Meristemomyces frigidus]
MLENPGPGGAIESLELQYGPEGHKSTVNVLAIKGPDFVVMRHERCHVDCGVPVASDEWIRAEAMPWILAEVERVERKKAAAK